MQGKVEICGVNTSRLQVLKSDEMRELLVKSHNGDKQAREKLIAGNLRLVLSVIQRFGNRGENPDDLFQVGCIGLMKAIDHFDVTQGVQFSTYGVPMIIGEVRRFLRDNNSVRVSRSMRDTAYKAIQCKERLTADRGREPTVEEIAKELRQKREDVVVALEAIVEPVSLYEPVYDHGGDTLYLMDQVGGGGDQDWLEEIAVKEAIRNLNQREKRILSLRFLQGKTQMEVAGEIGISQAQVSRLEKAALQKIKKEIRRFKQAVNNPTEAGVSRTYIETMLEMPWDKRAEEFTDIAHAKEILEAQHYGLKEVKERVLEYLSVRALTNRSGSQILCLVGPPGTGKTSIARSLAESMKKPYVRISLGGVRDEAEIRGHRKTYVGAMPGRIADGLRKAGVKNPVMLLDEIDKVSTDYNKGDTFSALLEVLDSEQNRKFRDHYLEVPLDLSEVVFVTTANTLQTIPRPLLDRMELIEVSSYTENEKMHIAKEHLLKKQLERHGLDGGLLLISDGALWKIIRGYTKEAGVRTLQRRIGELCRKAAREILESGKNQVRITERNLTHYLGKEKYRYHLAGSRDEVGIVTGLAWTSVGGDTLQIEVNVLSGKGKLLLTGQMGDVMKESAQAGISYIRSISGRYGIPEDFFETHDIHVHIPEGAVPKDGPSAGITMATAILSAVTGQKVRSDVAMTGEITLRGRVLPIGGLKEKLLAAKNAGIHLVLVPAENQTDVEELSKEITKGLEVRFVSRMEEVLHTAISEQVEQRREQDGN